MVQDCLKVCPAIEYQDDDWLNIEFIYHVHFTKESITNGVLKTEKENEQRVSNDLLRKLGYSEKSIHKRRL
jgi:dsRNA-specific ribonuclease